MTTCELNVITGGDYPDPHVCGEPAPWKVIYEKRSKTMCFDHAVRARDLFGARIRYIGDNERTTMKQEFHAINDVTEDGTPNGGYASGTGFSITWQKGALSVDGERQEPNGAFVETIIAAAKQRIEHYQEGQFACEENANAIYHLNEALDFLDKRTKDREARGVEGTHEV